MPVTTLPSAAPGVRLRGGGNFFGFVEIKRNLDGTFAALVGTDSLGDAAGSLHILGSHTESAWARDDKGSWTKDISFIEMDLDHKNLMEMVAPITAQSIIKDPDLTLEDGTLLVNAEISGDVTMPYFMSVSLGAPLAGKVQARFQVGQFLPADGWNQKPTEWSLHKIKFRTVDGNGYVCTVPVNDALTTVTDAPTLTVPYQHGQWVEGT
jgi:hypothetical protein